MDMNILNIETKLCTCCMEEHEVKTVRIIEKATFKGRTVNYEASYMYCDVADELYMNEQQMQDNDIRMKNAYRRAEGLLTSEDICNIRRKYGITQSDLCTLLGWGGKTITRYESHQVQDRAHDIILKKLRKEETMKEKKPKKESKISKTTKFNILAIALIVIFCIAI